MPDKLDFPSLPELLVVLLAAIATYAAILLFTRLAGLRSFSKMSASDFAMTVAVGSLFASTVASPDPSLIIGMFALALLYVGQWMLAYLRRISPAFSGVVDNKPLLLMRGGAMVEAHLRRANVTRADIYAKLREANVLRFDQVRAVVFETTGDISVLHTGDSDSPLDAEILADVVGWDASPT